MVFGILLILPIIDFAVAAPVPVQEKLQVGVDVAHPEDAITMMGKRGDPLEEDLYLMLLNELPKPKLSAASSSSSSRLPKPADGSTDVERPLSPIPKEPSLEPNPASSTANTEPLMKSSSPETTSSMEEFLAEDWADEDVQGSDHKLTGAAAPQPYTNPRPSKDPHDDFDWDYWMNLRDSPPPKRPKPATSKEFGQAQEYEVAHVQPNPGPLDPGPYPWNEFGQAHYYEVAHVQPNPGPSNAGPSNAGPSNPGLPTEPVVTLPSPNSQPLDPQAALYASKGKAKLERRVPGAARDIGNAVQRKLQLAERTLDPGQ
jgi:hypothetical protein